MTKTRLITHRVNISQPTATIAAWTAAATESGLSLSEWIEWACNAQLPRSVRESLPVRRRRGRPSAAKNGDSQ